MDRLTGRTLTTTGNPDESMAMADEAAAHSLHRPANLVARQKRREARTTGDLLPVAFVLVVLGLALSLVAWAPWRAERPAVSSYSARAEVTGPVASAQVDRDLARPPATSPPVAISTVSPDPATAPSRVGTASRPVGVPIKRTDWLILRDYVAHGGPSPIGAIDIGIVGNRQAVGTPVYATQDGTVKVLQGNRRYGNLVAVKNERWSTTYGHLDKVLVKEGQNVRRGDQIGTLGETGEAQAPQLDYQVWEQVGADEINRNPLDFLAPR